MGYLDEVIQLHTAVYDSGSHGGAVYASIGTYLNVVFENRDADLWNFFVSFRRWGKSEAIGADDASGMQDAVVAYTAVVIDGCARIEDTMTTYAGSGTDSGMRMQGSAVADYYSIAYVAKGAM